ncbi:MAG: type II secretion system inner membrane protein GspF [Pseudomonadota bacterium]
MPVYEYIGIDRKGKKAGGIVDADNERAARVKLRKMGVFPTSINLEGASKGQKLSLSTQVDFAKYFQRVKVQDIAIMTRQLSTLVAAGIPLVDSISALIEQVENVQLRTILSKVRERITEGSRLSDALKEHSKIFSTLYINMISAGENSGALDVVLQRLADFTEGQAKLRSKIIGAMIYPVIMSIVGAALMGMLLVFVVPKVMRIFEDVHATLPLPTQILMAVSNAVKNYWYIVLLMIIVAYFVIKKQLKKPAGRRWFDKQKLQLPLFGKLERMIVISRFSRTLATLLASGVPLLTAMDIVKNIVTNTILKQIIENTRDSVREGQSVAEPLRKSGEFPPIVTQMIAVGEKTGSLEKMLERIADTYDNQVDNTISALMTLLEPIMILVMAGVVSFIVMSILLPIMQLNQLGG